MIIRVGSKIKLDYSHHENYYYSGSAAMPRVMKDECLMKERADKYLVVSRIIRTSPNLRFSVDGINDWVFSSDMVLRVLNISEKSIYEEV